VILIEASTSPLTLHEGDILSRLYLFVILVEFYLQLGLQQHQDILLGTTYEIPDWEGGQVVVGLLPVAPHDGLGGRHHMVPHILRGTCSVQLSVMIIIIIIVVIIIIITIIIIIITILIIVDIDV